ncbi:hypothetical protein EMPS_00550 [Entomortierella parvispora]|uniref:C2H2-type domain-containing protein n=1 Tax=Entomortierella parvispora TaxID=205924 RepID=A0A9P3H153_9FUNG|nr:hypothetical protein EMPS_00550 [Entomortierella parvispora]
MTASALASPALSTASLDNKAQTSCDQIDQSQLDQVVAFALDNNNTAHSNTAFSPSPSFSDSCYSSPSPMQSHAQLLSNSPTSSPLQNQNQQPNRPIHGLFTPSNSQENIHQIQILGDHAASPASGTFLEMPVDPFMPARAGLLFSENEYEQPIYEADSFMPYSTTTPTAEDCQASSEYMYQQQRVKPELTEEQFAALGGQVPTSMGSTYMMSMARSFSDSQLSGICETTAASSNSSMTSFEASAALAAQAALNQATGVARSMELCDSTVGYTSHVVYDDDYYASANQHTLYAQQQTQNHSSNNHHTAGLHHHHHHSHRYSTSSLPTLTEESSSSSSMSPRSPFSNHGSISASSSCHSLSSSSYGLSRTKSEPSSPSAYAGVACDANGMPLNSMSGMLTNADGTPIIKPTPKRSRGRRVSCFPDNSGGKVFTCRSEDCGKVFKRSEHLKRHVRSIHTMEKPFECPINNCPKRFSRSDNLNQHIRIHRHNSGRAEKAANKQLAQQQQQQLAQQQQQQQQQHQQQQQQQSAFQGYAPYMQDYSADILAALA